MLCIPRLLSRRDELLKVQYVSKYLTLAEEGLCPPMECPMDKGSLLPNLNENEHLLIELKKDGDIEYRENSWKNN